MLPQSLHAAPPIAISPAVAAAAATAQQQQRASIAVTQTPSAYIRRERSIVAPGVDGLLAAVPGIGGPLLGVLWSVVLADGASDSTKESPSESVRDRPPGPFVGPSSLRRKCCAVGRLALLKVSPRLNVSRPPSKEPG
mmetsp:Transcript_10296/g.19614  ORF Transcript_10296/g.19614 Transcript_10296/m.19614 type:complete len:138 (-) Transcript_10296:411-824(-)